MSRIISYDRVALERGFSMNDSIFELKDYGRVVITLKKVMDSRNMTRNRLAALTGLVYNTINRYYQNAPITSVDLDVMAKICYVLDCEISDILSYEKPKTNQAESDR